MDSVSKVTAPTEDAYVPLSQHQEQTPTTFFNSTPVLHLKASGLDGLMAGADLQANKSIFNSIWSSSEAPATNGSSEPTSQEDKLVLAHDITAYIGSDALILTPAASDASQALRIPYRSIALHATQRIRKSAAGAYSSDPSPPGSSAADDSSDKTVNAVYLQLDLHAAQRQQVDIPDDEDMPVSLQLVPTETDDAAAAQKIFDALSACADLHPDENLEDDGDGGQMSFDISGGGSGGWITAENMHEFTDQFDDVDVEDGEDGGQNGTVDLSATRVRPREDGPDEDDESKWQRTG